MDTESDEVNPVEVLSSEDKVADFLALEDRDEAIYELSKTQLLWIAKYFSLDPPSTIKKRPFAE